jgi:hypothetical protein
MISDLFSSLATIFIEDQRIGEFCNLTFAKKHTVYIGLKPEEEPDPADYPIIAITEIGRQERGDGNPDDQIEIIVTVAIEEETVTPETFPNGVKLVEHVGLQKVEQLRELVENSILKKSGLGWKIKGTSQTITENFYPFFVSTMTIILSRPKFKRDGRGVREE